MARQLIQSMLFNTQPPHNYHNILKKKEDLDWLLCSFALEMH